MDLIGPVLATAQTIALGWGILAAFGPAPRLVPMLIATALWLGWHWAFARYPKWTARAGWLGVLIVAIVYWQRPLWATGLAAALDLAVGQWLDMGPHVSAREPLGYGVTALPALVVVQTYFSAVAAARGSTQDGSRLVGFGLAGLLLASLYNWQPVMWAVILYAALALAWLAYTRAEELSFQRFRGDVRAGLLAWGSGVAVIVLLATLALPNTSGMLWRPPREPDGYAPSDSWTPGKLELFDEGEFPDDLYPDLGAEELAGEGEDGPGLRPWLFVLLFVAVLVPVLVIHLRTLRRRAEVDELPPDWQLWPEFPTGTWRDVVVRAFVRLLARLSGRRPRNSLTASEHVARLAADRPLLAGPLDRLLGHFLPARYGAPADDIANGKSAIADVRNDWDAIQTHVVDEALLQAYPGIAGRLRVGWQRLRRRFKARPRRNGET